MRSDSRAREQLTGSSLTHLSVQLSKLKSSCFIEFVTSYFYVSLIFSLKFFFSFNLLAD